MPDEAAVVESAVRIAVVAEVPPDGRNVGTTLRTGSTIRQSLLADDTPDGLTFTVNRTQWLAGDSTNTTPRHHHSFQQIRWAESGSVNYGPDQDIAAGDIAYFPRAAWYGPQRRDQGITATIQFGFHGEKQHGSRFWSKYQDEAMAQLKARGVFEGGHYFEVDPATGERRERDAVEALYEVQYKAHTGREFVVRPEGYAGPIHMHPRAFDYFAVSSGVELKRLGCFFDHPGPQADVRISMLRLFDGGRHVLDEGRAQIAWTISPGLELCGRSYPELTYLYCPRGESAELAGTAEVELFLVDLPRLD